MVVPPDFQPDVALADPVTTLPTQEFYYSNTLNRWEGTFTDFSQTGTYKVIFYAQDIWQSVSLPKQVYVHRTDFQEKAILVVGEGDYGAGQPWENSNSLGTMAYVTLQNRWFGPDDIVYLNPVTAQDVDGNGLNDDVDGAPTLSAIGAAINDASAANKLTVYLIGQGSADTLKLSAAENLTASGLDVWLDTIQNATDIEAYVVVECQQSGSFADDLLPPAGKTRVVITSTRPGYESYCFSGGIFSFSQFFLNSVYLGKQPSGRLPSGSTRHLVSDGESPTTRYHG